MTPKQIEIGDKLLKILFKRDGKTHNDNYFEPLHSEGYEYQEILNALQSLESLGLVEFDRTMLSTRMLPKGYEAAEVGLQQYLKDQRRAAEVDFESKKTSISTNRWTRIGSAVAIVVSVFSLGLQLVDKLQNEGDEGNGNSQDIHYSKPEVLVSELIPEIANSLKHDSVFVKELAAELNKQK